MANVYDKLGKRDTVRILSYNASELLARQGRKEMASMPLIRVVGDCIENGDQQKQTDVSPFMKLSLDLSMKKAFL